MRLEANADLEHGRKIDENMIAALVEFWTESANLTRAFLGGHDDYWSDRKTGLATSSNPNRGLNSGATTLWHIPYLLDRLYSIPEQCLGRYCGKSPTFGPGSFTIRGTDTVKFWYSSDGYW